MKGKKNRKWHDLLDNSVDVEAISLIAKDVRENNIFNLGLGIKEFRMKYLEPPLIQRNIIHKDNITADFTEYVKGNYHEITGIMYVRVAIGGKVIEVMIRGFVRGNYDYPVLSYRMQDYLYTYMCASIRRHPKLSSIKRYLRFPESLKSYATSSTGWDKVVQNKFSWIEEIGLQSVEQLETIPDIPPILKSEKLKKVPFIANDETWEKREQEFLQNVQDIYEREKRYQEKKITIEKGEISRNE